MIQMVTNVENPVPVPVSKHPANAIQPSIPISSAHSTQKQNIKQPTPVPQTENSSDTENINPAATKSPTSHQQKPPSSPPSSSSTPSSAPSTSQPPATAAKKKKKRKNTSSSSSTPTNPLDESNPLPNEASIRGDAVEQWRARAVNRRALLAKAQADNALITADLSAALARVSDAEHAEATVNKGLVTARAVISQRDRALAELTSSTQELKGEHAELLEDKKRADKRLVILKTVSANLQEAREARDTAERKLDDSNSNNAKLVKEVEQLRKQVESLNMVKQQLSKVELELDELNRLNAELHVSAKRDSVRAAGLGAAGVMALSLTLRLLSGGGRK